LAERLKQLADRVARQPSSARQEIADEFGDDPATQ
jgi:hypothetical protein